MAETNKKKKEITLDKMPWEMSDDELRSAGLIETKPSNDNDGDNVIDIGDKMPWELSDDELKSLGNKSKPKTETKYTDDDETFEDIDTSKFKNEGSAGLRFEVSGMDTTKDKKKVLEKYYDNVRPINGGENFVMTDRETGEEIVLNKEGWIPSLSDFAGYAPDLTGGALGGVLGALGGSAGGTVFAGPVGTVGGAMAGGATGYAGGKNILQKGINSLYGNEDTQDTGDYVKGVAIDAALGAGGELGGYAIAPVIRSGKSLIKGAISKPTGEIVDVVTGAKPIASKSTYGAPDAPDVITDRLNVFKDAEIDPTIGMIGGRGMATKELNNANKNPEIQRVVQNVYDTVDDKVTGAIDDIGSGANLSPAETGRLIKQGVGDFQERLTTRNNALYDDVGKATSGINATGDSLNKFGASIKTEFDNLPEISKRNFGSTYQSIVDDLGVLSGDIKNGIGFDIIKETRTVIGPKLKDQGLSSAERHLYSRYYNALTEEMKDIATKGGDDILQKWQKANNSSRRLYDQGSNTGTKVMNSIINGTDEAAFRLISTGSKKDATKVRQIMNLVKAGAGPEAVGDIQSSVLYKTGLKNGQFDIYEWAKNFTDFTPEAKRTFGQGEGVSSVPGSLDKLSKAINVLRNDYGKRQNWSNTAAHIDAGKSNILKSVGTKVGLGTLTGGVSLIGDAGELIFNKIIRANPRQMTNPKFINTLTYIAEAKTPSELSKRINTAISKTKDETIKMQLREIGDELSR